MEANSKNELNPQISFTRDWRQTVQGVLRPGARFTVLYDPARLPEERSTYNGSPAWNIFAHASYSGAPAIREALQTPGGADLMSQEFVIPPSARDVTLWFLNTGRSGREFWDSDYGANYCFRFPLLDLELVSANVISTSPTPYSGFQTQVLAVQEVTAITVNYSAQGHGGEPLKGSVPLMLSADDPAGRGLWSVAGVAVPYQSTVRFSFQYTVGGRTFLDDNGGKSFTATNASLSGESESLPSDASAPSQRTR